MKERGGNRTSAWMGMAVAMGMALVAGEAVACSAVIVGKRASASGRVIVAHNDDGVLRLKMRYALVPAQPGKLSYFWHECKDPQGGITPGDTMLNECGVLVNSNNGGWMETWCGRKGTLPDEGVYSTLANGGVGYELRRTIAERAHTAREGVAIATNLLATCGYTQASRNFVIADKDEAWILTAVLGRRYVVRRCPDDEVVAYPNCMTVAKIRPGDIVSANIEARRADFDFTKAYQGPRSWKSPYNLYRAKNLYRIVCGREPDVSGDYPFSMRPDKPVTEEMVKAALRCHYEGTPDELADHHPARSLETSEAVKAPICRETTRESYVCTFADDVKDIVVDLAVGRPCETPYAKFRPHGGLLPKDALTGESALRRMADRAVPLQEKVAHKGQASAPLRVVARPGESLVALRNRVRDLPASNRVNGVEVVLPAGSYALEQTLELDARDSGSPDAPVVWRAAELPTGRPGEDEGRLPQIVAGIDLLPSAFRPVVDPALLSRLDEAARGKVLEADISKLRFRWPNPKAPSREIPVPMALPDLFVNGERMAVATFPAEGWCEMTKIVDRGTVFGDRSLEKAVEMGMVKWDEVHGGTFGYAEDRPARWAAHPHVAIQAFWRFDWRETVIYAKSIDPAAKTITLSAPHSFGLGQGNPAPRRWRAVNVFEELSAPGRYAVDFDSRCLYFYPPMDFSPAGAGICAAQEPTVRVKGAHDLVFDGLHFGRSSGNGLSVVDGACVTVRRCLFTDARDVSLVTKNSRRTTVRTCDFYRLGGGGAIVDDGVRRTLERGESVVEDCLFHHWNGLKSSANAVLVHGVGNAIRHCEMRDTSHQATGTRGNDCVFEYNVLSNICTGTDDAGAFYKGCNPSMRGNVIRYNYFRNIGRQQAKEAHGACAVYFDDGDCGDLVFGNVFEKASVAGRARFGAVFSHGGYSNVVRNCIFLDCSRPLGSGPWDQDRWNKFLNEGVTSDSLRVRYYVLKAVDITKPPFTTHYPELVGFMDPQPDEIRWNAAYDNAFVNCPLRLPDESGKLTKPGLVAGRWYTNETSVAFTGDPGFVDRAARDLRLRADSEIYRKIPNFKPIPFEKIGLLTREGKR